MFSETRKVLLKNLRMQKRALQRGPNKSYADNEKNAGLGDMDIFYESLKNCTTREEVRAACFAAF